ncbi:GIY-YIG nuclease family protein [Ferrimonas aestuarii]|uniref:GIY-YIG nuclease family protein n=1 Tax=Ferrimonas aestuarii TaxID=2569539 RepID=A0A4U1BM69_9GAMM|nr:GIY-YIG nuclease family protein [Ferrimonas aestuarii]TKB51954.1 GIY-YIG nuclease family protein [Ferrimonas aestuarii]
MSVWSLYLVRTASNHLYTGITTEVERRFSQHQNGTGAKALRGKGPLSLAFCIEVGDRSAASKLEYAIKQLSKKDKEQIVKCQQLPEALTCYLQTTAEPPQP